MIQPIERVEGVMAFLGRADINTDAIIPSPWLRTASADLGKGLFGGERYDEAGQENPAFILNQAPYRRSKLLLANENFGCGSSREAAVWALVQFGIQCVFAPSFADIFYENAFRNRLIAGLIDQKTYAEIVAFLEMQTVPPAFVVDLRRLTLSVQHGPVWSFAMPASRVEALLRGDDEIAATLRHDSAIQAFHEQAAKQNPWLFPPSLVGRGENI